MRARDLLDRGSLTDEEARDVLQIVDEWHLLDSPSEIADRLLKLGKKHATESHYRATKKGGRPASAALHMAERLRLPWGACIAAFAVLAALNWYQPFFKDGSTGDAAENQSFYNLILFGIVMAVMSMFGDAVQTRVGYAEYYDPISFKDYFLHLSDSLGANHASRHLLLRPNHNDESQCQTFLTFHLQVYQYLLNKDERAAAYMLTSFTRDFPYFWRRHPVSASLAGTVDDEAINEPDPRERITGDIFCELLGINPTQLNDTLRRIRARAEAIMQEAQDEPVVAKLQRRINAFSDRLTALIHEHINPEQYGALQDVIRSLLERISQQFSRVALEEEDMTALNFPNLFTPIQDVFLEFINKAFRPITASEQRDRIELEQLKRYARDNVRMAVGYWQTCFAQFLKLDNKREQKRGYLSRERGMLDLAAAQSGQTHVAGLQHNLLHERETMAPNARHLAALNQALVEEGYNLILNPLSGAVLPDLFNSNVGSRDEEQGASLDDPLNLALISGQRAVLAFVPPGGALCHGRFHIEGFSALSQDAAGPLERKNAARRGWLGTDEFNLPEEAKRLREAHPEWILPQADDPTVRNDFNVGDMSVLLACETYRKVHAGKGIKSDAARVDELVDILRRFIGHINPLELHRPGYELEAQLRDRAHVAAHLLHEAGYYRYWEHWIAHNEISTRAFMQLDVEHQVWLIFQLLSGPDYAKLVALSILTDPLFINAHDNVFKRTLKDDSPYNRFMRVYIKFMLAHVNDVSQPPFVQQMRKMLFVEQLTLMTDMSAGREIDPQTGNPQEGRSGYMAEFLNRHTRKATIILKTLLTTLTVEEAERHYAAIQPYLSDQMQLEHGSSARDLEPQLSALHELEHHLKNQLAGSSTHHDINRLFNAEMLHLHAQIGSRIVVRNNLFHVRWLLAFYKARQQVGNLFLCVVSQQGKGDLMNSLIESDANFVLHALPLNDANLDHSLLQLILPNLVPSIVNVENKTYVWHALAKLVDIGDHDYLTRFFATHLRILLAPDHIGGVLQILLAVQPEGAEGMRRTLSRHVLGVRRTLLRRTLLRHALLAIHGANAQTLSEQEKKAYIFALYREMGSGGAGLSVVDFYRQLVVVEPPLLEIQQNRLIDTMELLIQKLQEDLDNSATEEAVCQMLSYHRNDNIIDECIQCYNENHDNELLKNMAMTVIRVWLREDRLRNTQTGPQLHAHNYIIRVLEQNFSAAHFRLAAELILINLNSTSQRWDKIHAALTALAQACNRLDFDHRCYITQDQFAQARALFLLWRDEFVTTEQKYQLVVGLLGQYTDQRDLRFEEYADYIQVYVNDAYPIPPVNESHEPIVVPDVELLKDSEERIRHAAQKILEYLTQEVRVRNDFTTPLADRVIQAMQAVDNIIHRQSCDRAHIFLMRAMLERCLIRHTLDRGCAAHNTVVFNRLMLIYYNHMQLIPERLSSIEQLGPPHAWLKTLFFAYLRRFHQEPETHDYFVENRRMAPTELPLYAHLIQAFEQGHDFVPDKAHYWQRFRESCLLLHVSSLFWENRFQTLHQLYEMASRGFLYGNGYFQEHSLTRTRVISDAWRMTAIYLDSQAPKNRRRESLPDPDQLSSEAHVTVLARLYAYTKAPPEVCIAADQLGKYRTREALAARLIHACLSSNSLLPGVFHTFSVEVFPKIIRVLRGSEYIITNDYVLIRNHLLASLPQNLCDYHMSGEGDLSIHPNLLVILRLAIAYAYWKWQNGINGPGLSFLACGSGYRQYQVTAAEHVQAFMQILTGPEQGLIRDLAQRRIIIRGLGIGGAFSAWLSARLNQDIARRSVAHVQDDDETTPLLGAGGDELGRAEQGGIEAERPPRWACCIS